MKIVKFPSKINAKLAEETGWHIGDGSMNYYKNYGKLKGFYQLRGHIEDDRPHYISRIKPIFKDLYGIEISLREMPSTRVFGFQIWSNELVKFKERLGLKVGPKINVRIPSKFLVNNKLKIAVLRGIFDTDGCVYMEKKKNGFYPRLEIFTISPILADQMWKILHQLGFRVTKYLSEKNRSSKRTRTLGYKVSTRGNEMLKRFFGVINPKNSKHIAKYNWFMQSFK